MITELPTAGQKLGSESKLAEKSGPVNPFGIGVNPDPVPVITQAKIDENTFRALEIAESFTFSHKKCRRQTIAC
jgi:hypothetical protein